MNPLPDGIPIAPRLGRCLCGKIRYQLTMDPLTVYACHCRYCQAMTGASFMLTMLVDREAITLLDGEPEPREFFLADGRDRRGFGCAECFVWLWAATRADPETFVLWPGTLDDTSWFQPVGHIFTRSAQPWVTMSPGELRYESAPDSLLPVFRGWSSRPGAPRRQV